MFSAKAQKIWAAFRWRNKKCFLARMTGAIMHLHCVTTVSSTKSYPLTLSFSCHKNHSTHIVNCVSEKQIESYWLIRVFALWNKKKKEKSKTLSKWDPLVCGLKTRWKNIISPFSLATWKSTENQLPNDTPYDIII